MRSFPLIFLLSFFPLFALSQADLGVHRLSIRGDVQGVSTGQSDLFSSKMNGVIGGELSLQVPISNSFYAAVGGNASVFEGAEDPANLLQEEISMYAFGPFLKAGYRPYLGKIFYVDLSIKGSYRWLQYESPQCANKGRASIHGQRAFSAEPRIGLWWDTGDGLDFGAIVGRELIWDRFKADLICEDLNSQHPDASAKYGIWHFGFAFSADLRGQNR